MTGRRGFLPYWRRGAAVLAVALVAGPTLGALALALVETVVATVAGPPPSAAKFLGDLRAALGLALAVGVPLALAGGAVIAGVVARRGTIGYAASAAIAFLTPCVLGLPLLGGFAALAPFLGLLAVPVVLAVRALAGRLAARLGSEAA